MRVALPVTLWSLLASTVGWAQVTITPFEAKRHVGQVATVCGTVASASFAARSRGQPTFLNLERRYPNHIFTVVIWGSDRGKFDSPPEVAFASRRICVTGTISLFGDVPQIVVTSPAAIRLAPPRGERDTTVRWAGTKSVQGRPGTLFVTLRHKPCAVAGDGRVETTNCARVVAQPDSGIVVAVTVHRAQRSRTDDEARYSSDAGW